MSDRATMRARISSELRRDDLSSDILDAINSAIRAYRSKRFKFNETRSFTFTTVANQDTYTSSDSANIGNILKLDYIFVVIGGQPYQLDPTWPEIIEASSISSSGSPGTPGHYVLYDESIRLYPTPADAYTVRVGCKKKVAAPASDSEANNAWMLEDKAERLIRCRAKAELYAHVIKKPEQADIYFTLAKEAYEQLREEADDFAQVGENVVKAWDC